MLLLSLILACGDSQDAPKSNETPKVEVKKENAPKIKKAVGIQHGTMKGMDHSKMKGINHGAGIIDVGEIPEGAKVFFISPKNGDVIKGDVKVQMGVEVMTVKAAGEVVTGTGHHHILIDTDAVGKGAVVPSDDKHKHFGKGQTETTLKLAPGKHTLKLQFANGIHASYGEKLSTEISITVEAAEEK